MDEKHLGLLEALDIAMEAEQKANQFYTEAAEKVSSAQGKGLLRQLADFEQHHYDKLNALKNSLREGGEFIAYQGKTLSPSRGDVSSEVSGSLEANKDEVVGILGMAIDAETNACKRYQQLASETDDPKGKEMFLRIADEETRHRQILSDQFYQLSNKGGIWMWGE